MARRLFAVLLGVASAALAVACLAPEQSSSQPLQAPGANDVTLPRAAGRLGNAAGFYTDPETGNPVYRLSDEKLCPGGGRHFYSYTNQFSRKGNIVFDCLSNGPATHPIYDSNFKLIAEDAGSAAKSGAREVQELQWSQVSEVLFGRNGGEVLELDPFGRSTRVAADFLRNVRSVTRSDGSKVGVSAITALSVGPGDRLLVHLQCRRWDSGCPREWSVVGVATFDPATRQYAAIAVPHAPDTGEFDEAQWSQNPAGRVILIYANRPAWIAPAALDSFVRMDDNHGHSGYFAGADGRSYRISVKNDTVPASGDRPARVGQIGCTDAAGRLLQPWRREYALYDDATGKRALIFGCESPAEDYHAMHFTRSPGIRDVFGGSGSAILRYVIQRENGMAKGVRTELVAYTRSAMARCGYWAQPRAVMDWTGTRILFDSTATSDARGSRNPDGQPRTGCRTDVFVAVAPGLPPGTGN